MHFFLAALAGATLSVAQNTLDFASFGHKHGLVSACDVTKVY